MKHSIKVGFSFGLTSGIITTLGLMVGLHSGTHSRLAVIGGVLTIAIADAFSDALGIHISEESEIKHSDKEIWASTISTFLFKLIFASTFLIPIIFFSLSSAVIISILWGLFLLGLFSYYLARAQRISPWRVMIEHWVTALVVILLSQLVGMGISKLK
jgi:VIT1/CCC1 family predicted Fe2+/Mn2+ transporter